MKDPAWIEGDDVARGLLPEPPDNWIDPDEKKALLELKELSAVELPQFAGEIPETAAVEKAVAAARLALEELHTAVDEALDETVSEFDWGEWI